MKKEVKKEEPSETHSADNDGSSDSGAEMKEISSASQPSTSASSKIPAYMQNEFIYDINMLYETILKLNNSNFAGNPNLQWGKIKL